MGTPVLLLVGTFEPFNEAEARRVGADDVLTKPFQSIRELLSKVGQLLVRVTSPNTVEAQRRLSEFHDKLLAAMGRFNTQITAYTGTASLPPDELDIDLSKRLVYLIVEP